MVLKKPHKSLTDEERKTMAAAKERLEMAEKIRSLKLEKDQWEKLVHEQKKTIETWKKKKDLAFGERDLAIAERKDAEQEKEKMRRALEHEKRENRKIVSHFQRRIIRASKRNFYEGLIFGIVVVLICKLGMHLI